MHRVKSLFLTLLCAGMILAAGYLVIVQSGQKVLERERILEESVYEDTSSNIFYGKIEEDIELFPGVIILRIKQQKTPKVSQDFRQLIWTSGRRKPKRN